MGITSVGLQNTMGYRQINTESSFGDWLRQQRRALDLTQEELARLVGCSAITLRKLEAEERRPSKQIAERLSEVLKVAPDERPTFLRFARGDPFAAPGESKAADKPEPKQGPRHNLPLQLTSFIGREREIAELTRRLSPSPGPSASPEQRERSGEVERWPDSAGVGVRLLTLSGPGGTGKTRLALQVAAGQLDNFPDGVWLIELASLADPALVPQVVAGVLGLRETLGHPITAVLLADLGPKQALLVLDNCEHLIAACAALA
jgi:transcriptional regulator with XRE-family HTH domain